MNKVDRTALLEKMASGNAGSEDERIMNGYIQSITEDDFKELLDEYQLILNSQKEYGQSDKSLLEKIRQKIKLYNISEGEPISSRSKIFKLNVWYRVAAAAVIVLLLGVGSYFYFNSGL